MQKPFTIGLSDGPDLYGLSSFPKATTPCPTVILCHGFKGFFEWGFHPFLASLLVERGFAVVQFNFPGSGMKPGDEQVTDPEAFRSATVSRDLEALHTLVGWLDSTAIGNRFDMERLGLFGHSRGGGLAALFAREHSAIKGLVTWNGVGTFDRFDEDMKRSWREHGALDIANGRTGQTLPMGIEVLDDIEAHANRLDLEQAAVSGSCPWLCIHGTQDETVSIAESRHLAALVSVSEGSRTTSWLEIEGANHTLGTQHPFAGPNPHLIEAMNATQTWFRRHL